MRLKKIKLAGFKSFVDPTSIPFPGDMTAVVGPNGCGKSNVIDAVRWVLGESSAKNLRGDSMIDVIFNGSSARKPVSQCSVELIFDNSSGRISGEYAKYDELSVKRIVTKDAVSSYQLNSAKCRRRDVTDLFLGTGLGPRSYAIIEQGMISKLIESKPQELRVFIEEAAGISKYKERRRETENRIKHTNENLERLDDVRGELGQQLNKLQRQAAAATRYTELKARERQLKGELYAFKWQEQSNKLAEIQENVAALQTKLEQVLAQQTSDQNSVIALREQQADLKQSISDKQQEIFLLATDITKIEQSQIFTSKRKQQIQTELSQLQQSQSEANRSLQGIETELELVRAKIIELEPEKMLIDESIEQVQIEAEKVEQQLDEFNRQAAHKDASYQQLKANMQHCRSQVDTALSLQGRTKSRIHQLREESALEVADDFDHELKNLQSSLSQCTKQKKQVEAQLEQAQLELQSQLTQTSQVYDSQQKLKGGLINLEAKYTALSEIQDLASDGTTLDVPNLDIQPLWQFLDVQEGYTKLFESVFESLFSGVEHANVIHQVNLGMLPNALFAQFKQGVLFFSSEFSSQKTPNTLASLVLNKEVPAFLNDLFLVEDYVQGSVLVSTLSPHQSAVTQTGVILNQQNIVAGLNGDGDGALARAMKMSDLMHDIKGLRIKLDEAEKTYLSCQKARDESQISVNELVSQNAAIEQNVYQISVQLEQKAKQQALNVKRLQKITNDIEENEMLLAQEQEKLLGLNDQIEILDEQLVIAQEQVEQNSDEHQKIMRDIDEHRHKLNNLTSKMHQLELQLQQANNQFTVLNDKQRLSTSQLGDIADKQALLYEEFEELEMPGDEQNDKLQELIETKQQVAELKVSLEQALIEVQESLLEAEKGHIGINKLSDSVKQDIDSEKLLAEGCKVRAQSHIDMLNELQQPLKPILDNMPQDITEKKWQADLENTQSAISRLGAVNLAAVQEYEVQAERKQHLDTQNDDLRQALDLLESAIRKIDKETRSRFRHTFDQVNSDLKLLFPKVFGGGTAYLDLTDDDLLDTGVTIMARPPGKKNSTIHLLSGGEKALTALSLVFAIFRLNPAPFCLLDEVDAPLDDANVGRFCKLVSEMSKTVQFIYITHNKVAMEMATHLTGVTMAEPGVSRMVAVDIEEAIAIAE